MKNDFVKLGNWLDSQPKLTNRFSVLTYFVVTVLAAVLLCSVTTKYILELLVITYQQMKKIHTTLYFWTEWSSTRYNLSKNFTKRCFARKVKSVGVLSALSLCAFMFPLESIDSLLKNDDIIGIITREHYTIIIFSYRGALDTCSTRVWGGGAKISTNQFSTVSDLHDAPCTSICHYLRKVNPLLPSLDIWQLLNTTG